MGHKISVPWTKAPAIHHHFAGHDVYIICFGIHNGKHRHSACGLG